MVKLRLCVLSWNTVCMRLCPFQEIVLQLEANSVHLSLAGDVSCDHSRQGVTRFLCNFYIFSLATNQQSVGRHFANLKSILLLLRRLPRLFLPDPVFTMTVAKVFFNYTFTSAFTIQPSYQYEFLYFSMVYHSLLYLIVFAVQMVPSVASGSPSNLVPMSL